MPQPWERRPDESTQAYAAALTYFELGPTRSLQAVATKLTGAPRGPRKGPEKPGYLKRWSTKYQWVARAKAYDARDTQVRQAAIVEVIQAEAKSDAQVAIERRRILQEQCWRMYELVSSRLVRHLEEDPARLDGLESLLATFLRALPVADKSIAMGLPNGLPDAAPARPDAAPQQSNPAVRAGLIASVAMQLKMDQQAKETE